MGVPVEFDISQTGTGTSNWIPLNRWADASMRLQGTVSGTVTFDVEVTSHNVLRDATVPADSIETLSGWDDVSAAQTTTQDVLWRAIRVNVSAGTGTARLRGQTEGDC